MVKTWWIKASLIFLFLVALIGTLLRSIGYISIPFSYTHLVHAHSHVAFQGWVYTMMFPLLTDTFLEKDQLAKGRYPLQFLLTICAVIGILISFSLQGYGLYSILFSTLFQFLNYWFIYRFFKDVKASNRTRENDIALRFIKTGLWLALLSTLMPIGIGILSAKGLSSTEAYQAMVYTFLHLQYNGWFLFVVLGLFFTLLVRMEAQLNKKHLTLFYWLMAISVVPSISLSFLDMEFSRYAELPAFGSAMLLGAAAVVFLLALGSHFLAFLRKGKRWFVLFLVVFLFSFLLKLLLQSLSVLPFLKPFAFQSKPIIIAYIHLSLIGSISFFLLAMMIQLKWLPSNPAIKIGSLLLVMGFVATETLLVASGLGEYFNQVALIVGSGSMAFGILLMVIGTTDKTIPHGTI